MSSAKSEKLMIDEKTLVMLAMSDSESQSCAFGMSFCEIPERFASLLNFECLRSNPNHADSEFIAQEYESRCVALRQLAKTIPDSVIVRTHGEREQVTAKAK